jgi:hypothetical protein
MEDHRLLIPGYPSNWRIREGIDEGERIMVLGRSMLLSHRAFDEDASFSATMNSLTAEIAENDDEDPFGEEDFQL